LTEVVVSRKKSTITALSVRQPATLVLEHAAIYPCYPWYPVRDAQRRI
jgi:hypothetical protein